MVGGSSSKKTSSQGAWLGSEICEGHIEALRHHRLLPPASQVLVRIPGAETSLTPASGEVVVFNEHFYRGFGLPASFFFSEWLHFFGLQPHHLAPNVILELSAFVVLCEGFLGIKPRLDLWQSLFFFKQESIAMEKAELEKLAGLRPMMPCGATLVHHRSKSDFPQLPLQESIKQRQKGFFYMKNADPARDALNMPPFNVDPPTKLNWAAKFPKPIPEVAQIGAYLEILEKGGLLGRDLLTTMVTCRILPLQRRPHLVCQMSGRHDRCRTSTKRFTPSMVARRMNLISTARMDDSGNWSWGMTPLQQVPYTPGGRCSFLFFVVCLATGRLAEPAVESFAQMFEKLQAALCPRAPNVATADASEIEDEGVIESRSDSFGGLENALESEGTEPYGEYQRPSAADRTDDDEISSFLSDAAFEEDSDGVEEVTSPPLMRGQHQRAEVAGTDEAAGKKGKGATASREVEDVQEDTASAAERAGWTAADAAQRELEEQSKRRWDAAAGKMVEGQSRPSRAEKPVEKRTKARHDPSAHARVEEPASEAAPRRAPRDEEAESSKPYASASVDLEVIPNSPKAEAAPDAPDLIMDAPHVAPNAPGVTMDAPDAAHPPPVEEAALAGTSAEPAAAPSPVAGAIVVPHQGSATPGAGARAGSRPMKSWRAADLARARLPARTALHGVPELVSLFANSRFKVDQAPRVVGSDLQHLEERTRDLYDVEVEAYSELRAQNQAADGQVAELQGRLGEVIVERDALRDAGGRLQEQLALLQTEKKELEAASRVELEQLHASLQEKDASHSADVERLASVHLGEMKLKDAAFREKEEALVQKQTQLAKAIDSAATLQEEVARLTQASKVQELEVVESAHETDGAFHRLFPETQGATDTAVEVSREEHRAAGQEVDATSGWSVEEIGVGLRARLRALGESVAWLQVAGSSMVAALWPDGVELASMSRLARWLAAGEDRLDAWHASAARAGAYMALRLAKSWYRNLGLGKLVTQRDGSEAELQAMEEALRVRASDITGYAAWDELNLERGEGGNVIPEDLHGLHPYDADGSSDETAHEVDNVVASSGAAYADSGADGVAGSHGGDGATTSRAAGDGEATTSGAAAGATDEAAAP
ncbi:hypothetical protein D1007_59793 [Hordeum vulgare]|nr:hypothetical protein D1007_59793 [Hordeum vulgare]